MKQLALILLLFISVGPKLFAQDIKEVFKTMPESITPLLSKNNKADFVDFMESNMKAEVQNELNGKSEMTALDKDYISIQMTTESTWQMKLLPYKESYLIAIIETVKGPVVDSVLKFYTSEGVQLDEKPFFSIPSTEDFFKMEKYRQDQSSELDLKLKGVDMSLLQLGFSKDKLELSAKLTTLEYLNKEDRSELDTLFKEELIYQWEKGSFKLKS